MTKTPYPGLVWRRTEADPEALQNTPWQIQTRHHVFVPEALGSSIFFFLTLLQLTLLVELSSRLISDFLITGLSQELRIYIYIKLGKKRSSDTRMLR